MNTDLLFPFDSLHYSSMPHTTHARECRIIEWQWKKKENNTTFFASKKSNNRLGGNTICYCSIVVNDLVSSLLYIETFRLQFHTIRAWSLAIDIIHNKIEINSIKLIVYKGIARSFAISYSNTSSNNWIFSDQSISSISLRDFDGQSIWCGWIFVRFDGQCIKICFIVTYADDSRHEMLGKKWKNKYDSGRIRTFAPRGNLLTATVH